MANLIDSANDLARELSRLREVYTKLQDSAALAEARANDREIELHATIESLERRLAESEVLNFNPFVEFITFNFEKKAREKRVEMDAEDALREAMDGHDHRVELGESLASSLGGLVETSAALDAAKVQQ
jgi:hypothetical protein